MRPNTVYISLGLHILLLILATVSLPWLRKDFIVPPPVMVEFVDVSQITQTTKVAPPVPKPEEEKKPEETPPPPQPAQNTAKEITPPKPEPEVKDEKPEPKKEEKPEIDPNAIPDKKKPPEKPKEKKKEEKKPEPKIERSKDFSSVLKNLAAPKDTPPVPAETPDLKAKEAASSVSQNAPLGEKMTVSEEDLLRRQLEGCWSVPVGAKDAENLNIEIALVVNPDRTLREARVVDTSRYNSDTFFRAAADSAMRAVRNPLCSPFQLPTDKYDTWKTITVNFNPSQMF